MMDTPTAPEQSHTAGRWQRGQTVDQAEERIERQTPFDNVDSVASDSLHRQRQEAIHIPSLHRIAYAPTVETFVRAHGNNQLLPPPRRTQEELRRLEQEDYEENMRMGRVLGYPRPQQGFALPTNSYGYEGPSAQQNTGVRNGKSPLKSQDH